VVFCFTKFRKPEKVDDEPGVDESEYNRKGWMLYFGLPMSLFTGTYRMTSRKHFAKFVIFGFIIDVLYLLGMFYV
jgi:hypothetical protein